MKNFTLLAGIAALALTFAAARADIQYMDQYRSQSLTQTGDGNTLALNGWFSSTRLYASSPHLFAAVTVTTPNAAVYPLANSVADPATYSYQTTYLPSKSDMDTQFPAGTYTYTADTLTATMPYTADSYPASLPYLTGTDYADLQGMDPSQPFTFHFSPFTGANPISYIFLTLFDDITNTLVYDAGFLPSSTTENTLPANTLTSNDQYTYEVVFSNRVSDPSTNTTFDSELGFDYRTVGNFTAGAVPEPGSLLLAAPALLLIARHKHNTRCSSC